MLTKHTFIYMLLKGSAGLFGLITIFVFTRLLTPEEYGVYSMLISAMSILYVIFFHWLSLSLTRFYSHDNAQTDKFLPSVLLSFFIAIVISSLLLLFFLLVFKNYSWGKWFFILPFLTWSYAWLELNLRIANASLNPTLYGMLALSKAGLGLIVSVLLYFLIGLKGIFIGLILATFLTPVFSMRKVWARFSFSLIDKGILKKLIDYGFPLAITGLLTLVVDVSDRFIIAGILGEGQAGLYSASYDFVVQILGFVFTIFYLATFPIMVNNFSKKDYDKVKSEYKQYAVLLFASSVPLLAIFCGLASEIAELVFGVSFRESATQLIPVVALGVFVGSFKIHFFDLSFQLGHKTVAQIFPAFLTAVINILLNLLWIPSCGIIGAAYATLVAFSIGAVISGIMANRILAMSIPTLDIFKIGLSGASMYVLFIMLKPINGWYALPLQVTIGLVLYALLVFTLNVSEIKTFTARYLSRVI